MHLKIENLSVDFVAHGATFHALHSVRLEIHSGETLCLVGESGSGKSMIAFSILQLITPPGKIIGGKIIFNETDLLTQSEMVMQSIRGKKIAMIFQEPSTALNPVISCGRQISEVLEVHGGKTHRESKSLVIEWLSRVGLPDPNKIYRMFPHELSGGMRQRVMIAMALAAEPELVIADEPTTGLDVTIQAQILELLKNLQKETGLSLLFITHNLGIVSKIADRVAVLYAGEMVEGGRVDKILGSPSHPYTKALLEALPDVGSKRLLAIPGQIPDSSKLPPGCIFHPRCSYADDRCTFEKPPIQSVGDNYYACRNPLD